MFTSTWSQEFLIIDMNSSEFLKIYQDNLILTLLLRIHVRKVWTRCDSMGPIKAWSRPRYFQTFLYISLCVQMVLLTSFSAVDVTLCSSSLAGKTTFTESIYGTQYNIRTVRTASTYGRLFIFFGIVKFNVESQVVGFWKSVYHVSGPTLQLNALRA